ncbi:MAG TPA: peptidoglycan DD-metalloendopeptidase family protein [Pseudolabrys sp.]|nr:peptidoglycan DD-metalloendopeptidase family protein [Pseudolabrys sp.]
MSSTSTSYPTAEHYHGHYAQAQPRGHAHSAATMSRHVQQRSRNGYTLQHGGRQVRIGPVAFWIVVGTLVVMAIWSIATGTYFAFREDVLTRLIGRQAQMQFAYEDRIAELRAQVDRITSRQLLDQEQFEQKLKELLQRQATLEQRTNALTGDVATTGSVRPTHHVAPPSLPVEQPKPSPISDTVIFSAPPDREARLQSRELAASPTRLAARGDGTGLNGILARVEGALDKIAERQAAALTDIEEKVDTKSRRMQSVLADLGVAATPMPATRASGGPFVPLKPPRPGASAFDHQLYRINVARAEIDHLNHVLIAVPVRKPVAGEVDMSSPFGVRTDPFLGRPAMHTGIDMRGDTGEPVHATAAGKVSIAGRDGGYGNMVELDHGNGLATRYGHLSEIDVKVGDHVRIGQVIGKIGSTGRSTGPHLHYETRVNGEAVNPQKFLRAGLRLGNV